MLGVHLVLRYNKPMELPRYIVLEKAVGQTPLQCMEAWREQAGVPADTPLTYAGRLDPMASGQLLVLIGDECKKKDQYLALDKTYQFSVLLGIGSDTHDVLGRLHTAQSGDLPHPLLRRPNQTHPSIVAPSLCLLAEQLTDICRDLTGDIELPYPHFSSKTVDGKPLFQWALEARLDKIEIPTKHSTIYSLALDRIETCARSNLAQAALDKINTIPEVTDTNKSLGNDFRRTDVRQDWKHITNCPELSSGQLVEQFQIAHFTCSCSSGTYMRTLAKLIGERLNPAVPSLAWSIHRSEIIMPDKI